MKLKFLAVACVLATASMSAFAGMVNFEDLAVAVGTNSIGGDRTSGGFFFNSSTDHTHLTNNSFGGNSGSTFMVIDNNDGVNTMLMSKVGGGAFSFVGFDLGEWDTPATQVTVTGNIVGGGTVQEVFNLDGILSINGSNSFQSFLVGSGWNNLSSVSFLATGGSGNKDFGLDNILVDPASVPEPASLALLSLGALGLALRRRKH